MPVRIPVPPHHRPAGLTAWIKDADRGALPRNLDCLAGITAATGAEARRRLLQRALRRQRAGGSGYDPARHLALLQACRTRTPPA